MSEYYFSAGESQIIEADPNDSREGCGDEYEIINLWIGENCINELIPLMQGDVFEQLI